MDCIFLLRMRFSSSTRFFCSAYFNSRKDVSVKRLNDSVSWVQDLNLNYANNVPAYNQLYHQYNYDEITKSFYPTKNNSMELVNMAKTWEWSWWNPENKGDFEKYRKSDALFADMIVNTQGVYKAKRVNKGSDIHAKVKKLFEQTLNQHRQHFNVNGDQSVVESLIDASNLYWVDYQ